MRRARGPGRKRRETFPEKFTLEPEGPGCNTVLQSLRRRRLRSRSLSCIHVSADGRGGIVDGICTFKSELKPRTWAETWWP